MPVLVLGFEKEGHGECEQPGSLGESLKESWTIRKRRGVGFLFEAETGRGSLRIYFDRSPRNAIGMAGWQDAGCGIKGYEANSRETP